MIYYARRLGGQRRRKRPYNGRRTEGRARDGVGLWCRRNERAERAAWAHTQIVGVDGVVERCQSRTSGPRPVFADENLSRCLNRSVGRPELTVAVARGMAATAQWR